MTKEQHEVKRLKILELIRTFSDEKLNEEYFQICEKLLNKLARKRTTPLSTGKPEIWAMGVVHAVGTVNFLFDRSTNPYVSSTDLNAFYKTSPTTISSKSKQIRDMFKMHPFGTEFITQERREHNPLAQTVLVNGFSVPISALPPDMQEIARKVATEGGRGTITR